MSTDAEALGRLLERFKTLHPLLIDLSLGRIERLLARLGHPERRLPPVVHIAGTNGKGSTTAYLKAMLEAAGKRVHVYTSPHLVRFAERIEVAGADGRARPIDDRALVGFLERTAAANAGDPMTFFEITTAAAFLAFAETPADAVLLEVGLGGRLDATNVIARPALTIITPVSMDHAEKLGDTLAKIAGEKAGILKPGVTCVVSRQEDEALDVIRAVARRVGAPLALWGQDYEAFEQAGRLVYQAESELLDLPLPALVGRHQVVNAGAAVHAARQLPGLGLDERAIARGLVEARWPARMQRLSGGPLGALVAPDAELWLDGGHNPAGGAAIAEAVADLEERAPKPLVMVLGMMGQKDAAGFLAPFRGLAREVIAVTVPAAHEKAFAAEDLVAVARSIGIAAQAAGGIAEAVRMAGKGGNRVLICGSLYLAGSVLALQDGTTPQSN